MKHKVSEVKLKNGARGLLVNVPSATVMNFDINFRAGEYLVKSEKFEVPHLMEHVLLGANKKFPKARDFQAELEKNGAYSNASTGIYEITYEAECADFEWDRVLDLMITAISKPLFLESEFQAEYGNVQEEMAQRSNNHYRRLSLEMRKHFGLIAKTDSERLKLMKNVKVDDVRRHYKKTHSTPNMRFIIVGNITPARHQKLVDMLEAIELPKEGERIPLPDEMPKVVSEPAYVSNSSVENIYFNIDVFLPRKIKNSEIDALDLLNLMLTGTLSSKILGAARERGLVYSMDSGSYLSKVATNWWFGAQVSEKNAPALYDIIISEIQKVAKGDISDEEIHDAKQYALGRFQRSAQTVHGVAAGYYKYFFDDKVEDYYRVPARIKAITKEEIIKITNQMLKSELWSSGYLGSLGVKNARNMHQQIATLFTDNK